MFMRFIKANAALRPFERSPCSTDPPPTFPTSRRMIGTATLALGGLPLMDDADHRPAPRPV
ncbi:MAG: hypothetical protein AB7H81_19010, partial [Vicinamibacterales bacterium]